MQQVAFVSGSSRGIGKAIAMELARHGFSVGVNARQDSDELRETVRQITEAGGHAVAAPGNVSDLTLQDALLSGVEEQLGPLSTLVCNAGVAPLQRMDVLEASVESFDHCFHHNARGVYFLLQKFGQRMAKRTAEPGVHRSAIVISSCSAERASTQRGDYCVSKAGAAMAASVFAARLAPLGVQVADIRPGIIETKMSAPALDRYRDLISKENILLDPRIGQPDDVARAAVAVASGMLSYSVGPVLRVDGGLRVTTL